eukprot:4213194-Pleurochrysis_carterae.AAC.1
MYGSEDPCSLTQPTYIDKSMCAHVRARALALVDDRVRNRACVLVCWRRCIPSSERNRRTRAKQAHPLARARARAPVDAACACACACACARGARLAAASRSQARAFRSRRHHKVVDEALKRTVEEA